MDKLSPLEMFQREEQLMNLHLQEITSEHQRRIEGIENDRAVLHEHMADLKLGLNENAWDDYVKIYG